MSTAFGFIQDNRKNIFSSESGFGKKGEKRDKIRCKYLIAAIEEVVILGK
jgi:hypothetical protein